MLPPRQYSLDDLVGIVEALRNPKTGCPWDQRQTHESLLKYLIEETYELVDALVGDDTQEMKDELGDVLFQVIFHASIAQQSHRFDFADIVDHLCKKMIYRHPHVFANKEGVQYTEQEVHKNWQERKNSKHKENPNQHNVAKVKSSLPTLNYAYDIGNAAAQYGFDWPDILSVLEKIDEECAEIRAEDADLEEEIGDLLFASIQLCRKAQLDPDITLRKAAHKFAKRFGKMAAKPPLPETLKEWEERWLEVKNTK